MPPSMSNWHACLYLLLPRAALPVVHASQGAEGCQQIPLGPAKRHRDTQDKGGARQACRCKQG